ILTIVSCDRGKNQAAAVGSTRHGSDFVHGPCNRHHAKAAHAAKAWTHPGNTAKSRRAYDRAARIRSKRKIGQAGGNNRARSARRTARPVVGIPRILARAGQRRIGILVAQPACQLDHSRFTDENCSGSTQSLDHGRVVIKLLRSIWTRTPRRWISLRREQILGCIGNAMKRPTIMPGGDFFLRGMSLLQRELHRQGYVCVEFGTELLAALKVAL